MYDDLLFPTDGGDGAETGLERALEAARTFDADLHVLYVADTARDSVTNVRGTVVDALEEEGEEIIDEYAARADEAGVEAVDVVLQGRPHEVIVEYAEEHVDLVVMPNRGRESVAEHLLGSTTERVVRTSSVPVLTLSVA